MRKLAFIISLVLVFIASLYVAFVFEEYYRRAIRLLYEFVSANNISFYVLGKYIHFASSKFVFAFGLFNIAIIYLLKGLTKRQILKYIAMGLIIVSISTLLFCYADSCFRIIECTACDDGKRKLYFNDINYDGIFITVLSITIAPLIINTIIKYKKNKTN